MQQGAERNAKGDGGDAIDCRVCTARLWPHRRRETGARLREKRRGEKVEQKSQGTRRNQRWEGGGLCGNSGACPSIFAPCEEFVGLEAWITNGDDWPEEAEPLNGIVKRELGLLELFTQTLAWARVDCSKCITAERPEINDLRSRRWEVRLTAAAGLGHSISTLPVS